jgi:hypothetical protein
MGRLVRHGAARNNISESPSPERERGLSPFKRAARPLSAPSRSVASLDEANFGERSLTPVGFSDILKAKEEEIQ